MRCGRANLSILCRRNFGRRVLVQLNMRRNHVPTIFVIGVFAVAACAFVATAEQRQRSTTTSRGRSTRVAAGDTLQIAGLSVAVWRPPAPRGAVPLILFSHGFGGCATQSTFLTGALADAGYLIIAPNHADARCGGRSARAQPQ